jgi:hypothetical protein
MKFFVVILLLLPFICEGKSRFNEKPSDTCESIIIQQYNVNPTTCSSNFAITPSTSSYTIGEPVHITIQSTTPDKTFIGIILLAEDDKDTNVGSWQTTDSVFESVSCGGMMHSSQVGKTSVTAAWHPSSTLVESITIKAIIIENNATIYVNCYQIVLTLREEAEPDTSSTTTQSTSTTTQSTSTTTQSTSTTTQSTSTATQSTSTATQSTSPATQSTSTATQSTSTATQSTSTATLPTSTSTQPSSSTTQPASSTTQPASSSTQPGSSTTNTLPTTSRSDTTTLSPLTTTDITLDVYWEYFDDEKITHVRMAVTNLRVSQYAAIGIGLNTTMGENHVFMCKRLANNNIAIQRYINPGEHHPPQMIGNNEQGGLLTPGRLEFTDNVVICRFTLSNFTTETVEELQAIQPLSQSTPYHPKFAVGLLNSTNDPQKHAGGSVDSYATTLVKLNENHDLVFKTESPATGGVGSIKFERVHGIIMVFIWMLTFCIRV